MHILHKGVDVQYFNTSRTNNNDMRVEFNSLSAELAVQILLCSSVMEEELRGHCHQSNGEELWEMDSLCHLGLPQFEMVIPHN